MAVKCPDCIRLAIPELRNGYWVGGLSTSFLMAAIVFLAELRKTRRATPR